MPRNDVEANLAIAVIADAQRQRERLKSELNGCFAEVATAFEEAACPFRKAIEKTVHGRETYCKANRSRLLSGGHVKAYRFVGGEVRWRLKPPRVVVRDAAKAAAWFAKCEFGRFIRVNEELDQEAILREPVRAARNPFVSVCWAGEEFGVTPFETMIEETCALERS